MDVEAADTHDDAVAKALHDVLVRRAKGEVVSDQEIRSRYPNLLPDLAVVLEALHKYSVVDLTLGTPKAESPSPLSPGMFEIPGYSQIKRIRDGSQATVLQAIQDSSGRDVAIKFLHGGLFATVKERARLSREVDILQRLRHVNIVSLYETGEVNGQAYCLGSQFNWNLRTVFCERPRGRYAAA